MGWKLVLGELSNKKHISQKSTARLELILQQEQTGERDEGKWVTILSNILCSTDYFSLSWTSAALNKCYTYISIQTYLISLIGKQVQLMLIMIIWKIKKSDRNWFELQCHKQLPVIHFTEFVLICYLETGWKADYRCFENKVTSSFYKKGRVRLNLQKKKIRVSCMLASHHTSLSLSLVLY